MQPKIHSLKQFVRMTETISHARTHAHTLGSLQHTPDRIAVFKGANFYGEGEEKEGRGREREEEGK